LGKQRVVKLLSQSFLPVQGRFPRIHGEATTLKNAGYEVLIVGWDRTGQCPPVEMVSGVQVRRIRVQSSELRGPWQLPFLCLFWLKAMLILLPIRIDVVHCHNLDVLPLGFLLGKLKRCSVIYDAHEPKYYTLWPDKWHKFLSFIDFIEISLARRVNYIIVSNQYILRKFEAKGITNSAIIWNYPVDYFIVDEIPPKRLEKNEVIFGRIGTLYHDIGIEAALFAFDGIKDKYPHIKILLAGRVVDTYYDQLIQAARPLGPRVTLMGAFDAEEMPVLYRKIDVSLMTYRKTKWFRHITPTKFYDSLANGVPVIMTDIGGLGDIIRKYNCGIVVDENDIPGIREAMETMIGDSDLRQEMAENGLKLIKEEFNWKKMEERLLTIYSGLNH